MYKIYKFANREVFILKNNRYLNIKGMSLNKEQLQSLIEIMAVNYVISRNSSI